MVQVKKFYAHNDLRNYSYLLWDKDSGESWVIDPYDADPMIDYIKKAGLSLRGILNTHQHFDHIRGNAPLQAAFASPILKLKGGEKLSLSHQFNLETLDTPGHTMDHQVFVWKKREQTLALFSGDTLFNAGVGNCKNGGDVNVLYETVQRLLETLPPETKLYPGHDYLERNLLFAKTLEPENKRIEEELKRARSTDADHREELTLKEERSYNPFFRLDSEELKENLGGRVNSLEEAAPSKRDLFIKIRTLRDKW